MPGSVSAFIPTPCSGATGRFRKSASGYCWRRVCTAAKACSMWAAASATSPPGWQGIAVNYTGIDLSPELLEEGRQRYPHIELVEGDLFEFDPPPKSYDWVTLSGTLNRDHGDGGEYARSIIRRMYEICRKGIAFNLLDARHEWTRGRWDLQSFHPDQIAELVSELSPSHDIRSRPATTSGMVIFPMILPCWSGRKHPHHESDAASDAFRTRQRW